jgi:azurin
MVCFQWQGAVAPWVLILNCAVSVDNYVFATRQMHVARDCACLGLEVTNNGSDNLKVCHNGVLSAFRRDAKNNFVGMARLSSITLDAVKHFARIIF